MKPRIHKTLGLLAVAVTAAATLGCAPVKVADDNTPWALDQAAAKALAQKDSCLRCHGMTREKRGPAYSDIAAKYRGQPDAENRLYAHLTTGDGPLMPEEHKDTHKVIQEKKPHEIRNLVRWILAQ